MEFPEDHVNFYILRCNKIIIECNRHLIHYRNRVFTRILFKSWYILYLLHSAQKITKIRIESAAVQSVAMRRVSGAICVILVFSQIDCGLGQEQGQSCRALNGGSGTCRLIYECRSALEDLKAGRGKVLCKKSGAIDVVCCAGNGSLPPQQQTVQSSFSSPTTSRLRLADQKCQEYAQLVYEEETIPSRVPGQQPTVHREDKCSFKATQLIVGGTAAAPKEFPHMARLGFGRSAIAIEWACGGSIISRRFVLTAAHCISTSRGQPTFVRIGDLNFEREDEDSRPFTISVARTLVHPEFRTNIQYNDVGLVELVHDMPFSQYSRPACLNGHHEFPERRTITTGWGLTEFAGYSSAALLKVTLDRFQQSECAPLVPKSFRLRQGVLESQHLCAGSRVGEEKDACEGDSGSPMQVYHTGAYCMYKVVGVTSFGAGCGLSVGVYTRVSNFIDWIEANAFRHG